MDSCIRYVPSGFGRDSTCFLAKYLSIDITRGSYKISRDKKSRDKNVTDFNVADSVRRDIKVLVTKTRYTVFNNKCHNFLQVTLMLYVGSQHIQYNMDRFKHSSSIFYWLIYHMGSNFCEVQIFVGFLSMKITKFYVQCDEVFRVQ